MRWLFGPPHLTLKPSKKIKNNPPPKKKNQTTTRKKQKTPKNFQLSINILCVFCSVHQSIFWQPGPKHAHPPNSIKIGVSENQFLENSCASQNGHFWTPKTQIQKWLLSWFLGGLVLFFQQQKAKNVLKPLFLVWFRKPKNIQNLKLSLKLKTQKIEKPNFCTFFLKKKALENYQIIITKKTQDDNWVCKIAWNHYKTRLPSTWPPK